MLIFSYIHAIIANHSWILWWIWKENLRLNEKFFLLKDNINRSYIYILKWCQCSRFKENTWFNNKSKQVFQLFDIKFEISIGFFLLRFVRYLNVKFNRSEVLLFERSVKLHVLRIESLLPWDFCFILFFFMNSNFFLWFIRFEILKRKIK